MRTLSTATVYMFAVVVMLNVVLVHAAPLARSSRQSRLVKSVKPENIREETPTQSTLSPESPQSKQQQPEVTTTSEPVFNEELEHNADDDGDGSSGAVGSGDLISEGDFPNGGNEDRTTKAATTSIADPACVLKTISGAACITQPYAISAEEGSPVFNACGDIDLAPW